MHTTKITRALAGFAPAGKLSHRWISGSRRCAISSPLAVGALLCSAATALWSQGTQTYTYSVLHTFTGAPDGDFPYAGLVRDKEGNLYGTTAGGGNSPSSPSWCYLPGCGVVFKIDPKGKETILYNFTGSTDGGEYSFESALILDEAGNLHGTTNFGGDLSCYAAMGGCGVVFKVDPAGNETVLYAFTGGADGYSVPFAPTLFRDKAGDLYGTTYHGGDVTTACPEGCGVVFKISPAGKETVLYTFNGVDNNEFPEPVGPLVRDEAGNFYGTTVYAVFKLDPAGNETLLYTFTDGQSPCGGGLIWDNDGNLYGTTCNENGSTGTVFKVDPAGNETTLYSFTGGVDGGIPDGRLVRDPAGNLYGTTLFGGDLS
jgi:uncharacterized repeat protein (TIGR03803 family)